MEVQVLSPALYAEVAELVDARVLGTRARKGVQVRVLSSVLWLGYSVNECWSAKPVWWV